MATWKGRQPAVDAGNDLPAELLAGPDVALWCPEQLPECAFGRSVGERERSAAYSAWSAAGAEWGKEQGLPASQRWTELLPPELVYVATSLGRAHVIAGGLGPTLAAAVDVSGKSRYRSTHLITLARVLAWPVPVPV